VKVKIMHDAKQITKQDREALTKPCNDLTRAFFAHLVEAKKNKCETSVDVGPLVKQCAEVNELVKSVIKRNLTPKNITKFHDTFSYFGGDAFLSVFLNDRAYRQHMVGFYRRMKLVLEAKATFTISDLILPSERCRNPDCFEEVAEECNMFAGSSLCGEHHREQYDRLVAKETCSVQHFIAENGAEYGPIARMVEELLPTNTAGFVKACHVSGTVGIAVLNLLQNFMNAKPNIRRLFAEGLNNKYLSLEKATHPNEVVTEGATTCLQSDSHILLDEKKRVDSGILDVETEIDENFMAPALKEVLDVIEPIFQEKSVLVASHLSLPDHMIELFQLRPTRRTF
jgi:hypothetical protein